MQNKTNYLKVFFSIILVLLVVTGCMTVPETEEPKPIVGIIAPQITDCQLLMTEEEVKSQGIEQQRRMYSVDSRQRISEQAVQAGFSAGTRVEAMKEFNCAWRFNPENAMAYWGAAMVRGCEALDLKDDRRLSGICWEESIQLWEKGALYLNHLSVISRCEFRMDQAAGYALYAEFLQNESKERAVVLLEKAEALIMPYHNCRHFFPEENRRVNVRVSWQLKQICTLLGRTDDAMKYQEEFLRITSEEERESLDSTKDGRWSE